MFKQLLKICTLVVAGGMATASWANVPAPPVNQNIGIPDGVFNNLERQNCWYCHIPSRLTPDELAQIGWSFEPPEVKPGVITDRHHARVGTIIQDPTQAPNGVPGDEYECLTCHIFEFNPETFSYEIVQNFTDCLNCHEQVTGASVHHLTAPAQALNCQHCHGARIDNPGDGHYIPTGRPPTLVTPRTSAGKGPNGEGACDFCHNTGIDDITGRLIPTNAENHHSTGIGQPGISDLDCTICHDQMGSDWAIRRCEDCHGIKSIHNIQFDSNGDDVITIGGEDPFYGHVGSSPQDCNGCHGGYMSASFMPAPFSGPIVPDLTGLSEQSITSGSAVTVTVSGMALTNELFTFMGPMMLKSKASLTASDGSVVVLTPDVISPTSMDVTLPADLDPGNYYLRAVKGPNMSNPMALVVRPQVAIDEVSAYGDTLTITGSGFGAYLNAVDSGTSVTMATAICSVDSWTDSEIVANCDAATCGSLEVESIFGSASEEVSCN